MKSSTWRRTLRSSQAASRWFSGLEKAVYRLERHPYRCRVAPECRTMKRKLRHLLYGKRPHAYRVIYEIDERLETIWVLTIRHGARQKLKRSNLP